MESTPKLQLKLVIDKSKQRVVFAEAGKDFVDFLFHVHTLLIATLTHILAGKADSVDGCVLHDARPQAEPLGARFPYRGPKIDLPFTLLLPSDSSSSSRKSHCYMCPTKHCAYKYGIKVTDDTSLTCPGVDFIEVPVGETGYVKELVKYVVMDDLVVKPMTIGSCIVMLKDKAVMIEDKFVNFGVDEGKLLLEASLQSKTVLTDVFLGKKSRNDVATITPMFYRSSLLWSNAVITEEFERCPMIMY
ncbi:uncharacterized protein LOC115725842 [Rhodamnia argentea]|uniref:Uncharacterized protein LOC115725842 n=1 Tax=Rhodamnia argentea TaxID=178133 RepID=A0ABM3HUH6_9MYRT|nr:uncharacterized protein LOC115725842 [Rhodamnia argentea]